MKEDLSPCPFCGYPAHIIERATKKSYQPIEKFFIHGYQIGCLNGMCGVHTPMDANLDGLKKIWNKRYS